jgi:4-hydroxy-tetrahydrodipicolinate synthase
MVPEGIIPPLITPLTSQQAVDVSALKKLIGMQLQAGTPALFLCGTAGLGSVLTLSQYETVIGTAKETVPPDYPLLCGVLEPSTIRSLERLHVLETLGVKLFVAITPYYIRASGYDDLLKHFGTLRERTDMEMVLYNMPGCTGTYIEPKLVFDMARRGWSTTIKDSSGNAEYFESLCINGKPCGLQVYQGLAPDFDWLNRIGAAGCVPVPANRYPELFHTAWQQRGNAARLATIQTRIDAAWNELVKGTDYISGTILSLAEQGIGEKNIMLPFSIQ